MKLAKGTKLFVNGYPKSFGYSLNGDIEYNIQDAKLPLFKLKEWDFYQIVNRKFSLYFIIGHVSYATSINVTLFEFDTNKSFYIGKLLPFKKVKLENNANCNSNVIYKDKDYYLSFRKDGKNRFIEFMANGKGEASVRLTETLDDNVLVATRECHTYQDVISVTYSPGTYYLEYYVRDSEGNESSGVTTPISY